MGYRYVNGRVNSGIDACILCCLLYTSDAADDLTRVDLGGRRIIKKMIYNKRKKRKKRRVKYIALSATFAERAKKDAEDKKR